MAILLTGGAGYIGSHTCVEMLENGYDVIVVDNLNNSSRESLNRVRTITGKDVKFYENDVCDKTHCVKYLSKTRLTQLFILPVIKRLVSLFKNLLCTIKTTSKALSL